MKALVYTATQRSEIRDVPAPQPEPGQSLIDLHFCGICGSDMHAWHGHDERRIPPLVLGHEAVGIAKTGPYAGQRVVINPLMSCHNCAACTRGDEHLCPSRELIGMRVPGGFAEQIAVADRNLAPISDDLSFEDAALVEPLACAVNAVSLGRGRHTPHERVVILGGGAIGLLAAYVYRHHGYQHIAIAETSPVRREMLEKLALCSVYDPLTTGPGWDEADIVFDAVGSGKTRAAASALVRPGGTIIHIGLQDNDEGLDTRRLTLQEIAFFGSYCYRHSDFLDALKMLESGAVSGAGWAEIRSLDDGAAAFEDIHNGMAPPKIILNIKD